MAGRELRTRRDGLVVALGAVLVALLVIGAVAVVLAAVREHEDADESQREATELVKVDVSAAVNEQIVSLTGTSTIVADDSWDVDPDRWELFAREASGASRAENQLSLVTIVPDADRAAFESRVGPIRELDPNGELVAAARRPSYLPIRAVASDRTTDRRALGFDLASEPTRARATERARNSGEIQISEPVVSLLTGNPTFFVVKPLYRLGATLGSVRRLRDDGCER
jgi:CHASE1-domain containing sensor protein